MSITYILRSDIIYDESNNKYTVYGITAITPKNEVLTSISDIFFDKGQAENFVNLCNSEKVELVHLQDVAEDQLY